MLLRIIPLVVVAGFSVTQITQQDPATTSTPAILSAPQTDSTISRPGATVPPGPTTAPATVKPKAPPQKPKPVVAVLGIDSVLTRDSVRVILERDFDLGDRIKVFFLDTTSRMQMTPPLGESPAYDLYERFGIQYIVRTARTATGLRVALYNVPQRKFVRTFTYSSEILPGDTLPDSITAVKTIQRRARLALHRLADDVELAITGVRGISATRIVYVHGNYLRLIDYDGANDHAITSEGDVLSPAWHPRGTSIVYAHLGDAGTQIAQLNFVTGKSGFLNATPRGLNITPIYTPRGDSIVYATSGPRGTRLVIAAAQPARGTKPSVKPIPSGRDVDRASPTFRSDGKRLAFVASLPSFPQIYTMRPNGTDVHRLVPYAPPRRNDRTAPDWSPDGRYIAYQQQNRRFQIWMMRLRDSLVTQLTTTAENEDPSWAPDSRHIVMTSTRGPTKELWILDIETNRLRQLTHSPGARLAAWSPRLR